MNNTCYVSYRFDLNYAKDVIDIFIFRNCYFPLDPNLPYHVACKLDSSTIKEYNKKLLDYSDELWVVGEIDDHVLEDIKLAKCTNTEIKFINVKENDYHIIEKMYFVNKNEVKFSDWLLKRYEIEDLMAMI